MLKKFSFFLICTLFLSGYTGNLFALDLTIITGAGNFSFDKSSETPLKNDDFKGNLFPFGKITIADQFSSEIFGHFISLERDPVLRNMLTGEITLNTDYFKLSVGPYFGLFNSWNVPLKPGISAGVGLEIPGIIFFTIKGISSFGSINEKGDYELQTSHVALGFWLPNLINTFSLTTKKFSIAQSDFLTTKDELFRLCYRADIHAKGVPYTISIDMGFQYIKRFYYASLAEEDTARCLFLGFETSVTVLPSFILHFGAECPIFVWRKGTFSESKINIFIQGFAGFTLSLGKKSS